MAWAYALEASAFRQGSNHHWNDRQSLEQTLNICLEHVVDLEAVKQWSVREGHEEKFEIFLKRLGEKSEV